MDKIQQLLYEKSSVRDLNLFNKSIGNQDAQFLAKTLETNTTLTIHHLGNNQIREQGAQYLAVLLEETNTTLTTLILGDNQFGYQGA
jgi:Ran GTPase-activating protein (RanGAP) involved in mRNA processing and transport